MKFSELQQVLQEKFGIDHLADIARELDVSPQAVSNWKSRDSVPYKYVLKIREKLKELDTQVSDQNGKNASDSNQVLPQFAYSQYSDEDSISLMDLILILAKHFRIIIIVPTICCILTIIYVQFFAQPVYVTTAKIMSVTSTGRESNISSLAAKYGIQFQTQEDQTPQWVYPEIIKSRTLARKMLKREFNTIKHGSKNQLIKILSGRDFEQSVNNNRLIQTSVNSVISMIKVIKSGSFYILSCSAFEPQFVADFANALIEELDKYQREYKNAKVRETRKFIEDRIVDVEIELNNAELDLKNFRDRNRRIENSPSLLLKEQRLTREVVVLTGVFTTLKQNLESIKIEEVRESGFVQVLDPPEAPLERSSPKKKRSVIYAGFFGIAIGMVFAFAKELLDKILSSSVNNKLSKIINLRLDNIKKLNYFRN